MKKTNSVTRWRALLLLCLLLLVSCSAVPRRSVTNSAPATATVRPEPTTGELIEDNTVSAYGALGAYREQLAMVGGGPADEAVLGALHEGLLVFAVGNNLQDASVVEEAVVAALSPNGSMQEPTAVVADFNGDAANDLLVAPGAIGVPAYAIVSHNGNRGARNLLSGMGTEYDSGATAKIEEVTDVTGDGVVDAVLTFTLPGASALNTVTRVYTFRDNDFVPIFEYFVTDWAGSGEWVIEADGGIITRCAALGVFDHKLLPHPIQTRVFRYDAAAQRYLLDTFEQEPARTRRQAVNEAEAALQRGELALALERYTRAAVEEFEEEDSEADWRALANLRLAMLHAFFGNAEEMPAALDIAAGSAALEPLVDVVEQGYLDNGAVGVWAALGELPSYEQFYIGNEISRFDTDAAHLRLVGYGAAAFLNAHPEVLALGGEEIARAMQDNGLSVTTVRIANLDNDPAVAKLIVQVTMPAPAELTDGSGEMEEFWLLDQSAGANGYWAKFVLSLPKAQLGEVGGTPPVIHIQGQDGRTDFPYVWDGEKLFTIAPNGRLEPSDEGATCLIQ